MLEALNDAIVEGHMGIRDREMLGEATTFRLQSSGRFEHDSGCHDDSLFYWAIAWQMRHVRKRGVTASYI